MAIGLEHILTTDKGDPIRPWHLSVVRYGRCLRSPYVEDGLWFITVPAGQSFRVSTELQGPDEEHTFLVDEDRANPASISQRRRDVIEWRSVAHEVFVGPWCTYLECLWQDVSVNSHILPNGSEVKYGYCRTQSPEHPERELWFVSFRDAFLKDQPSTFVVDVMCIDPQFLDRISNDHWKWMIVCWCRLDEGNEVRWERLRTGTLDGGYVRTHTGFSLDSPYLPFQLDDIVPRINLFEDEISASCRRYDEQHKRLLGRKEQWHNLDETERNRLEVTWRQQACQKIMELNRHS